MKKLDLKKLIITTMLLALAIVLDIILTMIPGLGLSMPFGGKFFGISLLPLILIGLLFGPKYGLLAGFTYAIYNFTFDYVIYLSTLQATLESWTGTSWGVWHIVGLVMLDFVIPFTGIGLAGLFHKKNLTSNTNLVLATTLVSLVRWISATLGGVILWGSSIKYAADAVATGDASEDIATKLFSLFNGNLFIYSAIYNLIYILTTALTVILLLILLRKRLLIVTEKLNLNITN